MRKPTKSAHMRSQKNQAFWNLGKGPERRRERIKHCNTLTNKLASFIFYVMLAHQTKPPKCFCISIKNFINWIAIPVEREQKLTEKSVKPIQWGFLCAQIYVFSLSFELLLLSYVNDISRCSCFFLLSIWNRMHLSTTRSETMLSAYDRGEKRNTSCNEENKFKWIKKKRKDDG